MSQVRLHIDALALYGVPPEQAGAVVAALRAELTAQLCAAPPVASAALPGVRGALPAAEGAALGQAAGAAIAGRIRP